MPPSWTTPAQLAWLEGRTPQWHEARSTNKVNKWLIATTAQFAEVFSIPESDVGKLPKVSLPLHPLYSNGYQLDSRELESGSITIRKQLNPHDHPSHPSTSPNNDGKSFRSHQPKHILSSSAREVRILTKSYTKRGGFTSPPTKPP